MKFCTVLLLGASCLGLGAPIRAADPADTSATPSAATPTTAPAADEIERLILQLGDPDPARRTLASRLIKQIGKPALPALKQAMAGGDPEIQARASQLVRRIERRSLPGGPLPSGAGGAIFAQGLRVSRSGNSTILDVSDSGRKIHIEKGPDGIRMTVTGVEDGREVTETYTAKTAAELKEDAPEAYAVYERWGGGEGQGFVIHGGVGGVVIQNMVADPLDALRERLQDQIRGNQRKLTNEEQRGLLDQLEKVRRAYRPQAVASKEDLQEYFKQSDELRKKMAELKITDPAPELPPPSKARLGIELRLLDLNGGRLLVQRVVPGSRAEKLGLKEGDELRKLDGKEVHTVDELRRFLAETDKPVTVEAFREGEAVELKEK